MVAEGGAFIAAIRHPSRPELIRLAYVSVASEGVGHEDLEAIATVSRIRNRRAGLTGFLIHQGGRFHGVLEGPQRALFARMEAIVTDCRHNKLMVVREDEIDSRRFQNWSVGFLPDSSEFATDDASVEFLRSLTSRM